MALYTFYPCTLEDTSLSFEACDLPGDAAVPQRADAVLADHASAAFVVVYCGDRRVMTRERPTYSSAPDSQERAAP
jgi:hypothetical protein